MNISEIKKRQEHAKSLATISKMGLEQRRAFHPHMKSIAEAIKDSVPIDIRVPPSSYLGFNENQPHQYDFGVPHGENVVISVFEWGLPAYSHYSNEGDCIIGVKTTEPCLLLLCYRERGGTVYRGTDQRGPAWANGCLIVWKNERDNKKIVNAVTSLLDGKVPESELWFDNGRGTRKFWKKEEARARRSGYFRYLLVIAAVLLAIMFIFF